MSRAKVFQGSGGCNGDVMMLGPSPHLLTSADAHF